MADYNRRFLVVGRIKRLIGANPAQLSPSATAMLAQLRHGIAREPGSLPEIWSITLDGIPEEFSQTRREREEQAIHRALTQFATHQQSRSTSMHSDDLRFGAAIRRLAELQAGATMDHHETPTYRRFIAMAATTQVTAALTHARGLISQLRTHEIPFDYGRYTDDLYDLQTGRADDVRRRWGRDYHRIHDDRQTATAEGEAQ